MGRDPVADAINALADGEPDDDDELEEGEDDTPDVMAIVEAMAAHWESETHESIMCWSWPLFCTKWARLYEQLVAKRKYERKRDEKRQRVAEHRKDEQWFAQVQAGGSGREE